MGAGATLEALDLRLPGHTSGKVREAWEIGDHRRLLVTTDRLSAFDRVVGLVENKGQVLNQLSAWWFDKTRDIVANHVIAVPDPQAMVVVDATPLPVEVVVRGRLTGSTSTSLLPRYQQGERLLYGYTLPDGLSDHGPLPEPLITPTTKAEKGQHDEPITCDEVIERGLVEAGLWAEVQKVALAVFERGTSVAADAGFVLADTKYEFGLAPDGSLVLIDEVHTPDSSRFWDVESLEQRLAEGKGPESFDKEPVRLALKATGYRGDGPPPELAAEVWQATTDRYVDLYQDLTGLAFEPGERPIAPRVEANIARYLNDHPSSDPLTG
ncbi:MAG: phosphoribosylaminoimidazolesuccinocarboxamide synthase [Acidimicrobiia bacterium]|nr:phosphoribosylaminoimidazolesuccinocarboxamide synthase [Acidimicrobiia bacterium]